MSRELGVPGLADWEAGEEREKVDCDEPSDKQGASHKECEPVYRHFAKHSSVKEENRHLYNGEAGIVDKVLYRENQGD